MKRFRLFITLLSLLTLFTGCHSLIEDTFPARQRIPVLNSVLSPDSLIRVHLSLSAALNDSLPLFIENADVEIHSTEGWTEKLVHTDNGYYTSIRTSKINETYTCQAKIEGFPLVTASTTIPPFTDFDNIIFIPTASKDEDGRDIAAVHFSIVNHTDKQHFWEVRMLREGLVYDWDSKSELLKIREADINMLAGNDPVLQNEALPLTVFSNKKMVGNSYEVVFYTPGWALGSYPDGKLTINESDNFYIELRSADESFYYYQKQAYLYKTSGGTGFGSATQSYALYSNVKNGLGIFTSFSPVRKKIELKNK